MADNNHKNNNHKKDEKLPGAGEKEALQGKSVAITEEEYNKLKEDACRCNDLQDRMIRLQADFENARKRMEKQSQDFAKYANEGIILELLTILDELERAAQMAENKASDLETFLKGIEMILAHLYEMLREHGVKPVEVAGRPFDLLTCEALMQVESDLPENTVVEELQKGYFLNDRVIRTAKVKVSKEKVKETKQKAEK